MRTVERMNFSGEAAPELKRLQDNVIRAVDPLTRSSIVDGVLVGPVPLTTSFAPVAHGLGRQFRGWIVIRNDTSATAWEDFTWNAQAASISMRASAACSVYLWVF